jgi:hypothetical protein
MQKVEGAGTGARFAYLISFSYVSFCQPTLMHLLLQQMFHLSFICLANQHS